MPTLCRRIWRYAPLLLWMALIFTASTTTMSAGNTSRFLRPFLMWLFPAWNETQLLSAHFFIRKCAHFTEYAILAALAARAFVTSSKSYLRRYWFGAALLLVIGYALLDEWHQSFVPTRTGSLYDSLIDSTGGLFMLLIISLRLARRRAKSRP